MISAIIDYKLDTFYFDIMGLSHLKLLKQLHNYQCCKKILPENALVILSQFVKQCLPQVELNTYSIDYILVRIP